MAYVIFRVKKLKSALAVRGSLQHTFREIHTPNAIPSRTPQNQHAEGNSSAEVLERWRARLPDKFRKDAVTCLEVLITGSPEAMAAMTKEQQDQYFKRSLQWVKDTFGVNNVIAAAIHRDETTPHLVVYVVPVDAESGKLNAKRWLGGPAKLRALQTDIANTVGKQHGLERGIEGSRATHTTIREFYTALNNPPLAIMPQVSPEQLEPMVIEKRLIGADRREDMQTVANRVNSQISRKFAPVLEQAAAARLERQKAQEAARTNEALSKQLADVTVRLSSYERDFGGLDKPQRAALAEQAFEHRKQNALLAEMQRRVDQLAKLFKTRTGAIRTFCRLALEAIKDKAGEWREVNWPDVETVAMRLHVVEQRQDRLSMVVAIADHSPGWALRSPSNIAEWQQRAEELDKKQARTVKKSPSISGPSLG